MHDVIAAHYDEMKRIAVAQMRKEARNHTFCPTDLVAETVRKLLPERCTRWDTQQLRIAAVASMRRILIDHQRRKIASRRGGGLVLASAELDEEAGRGRVFEPDVLDLDGALTILAEKDPLQARIAELHLFGGYNLREVSEIVDVAYHQVKPEWQMARAFLRVRLAPADG